MIKVNPHPGYPLRIKGWGVTDHVQDDDPDP